jgi:superfamily II DNA or RNA helicase
VNERRKFNRSERAALYLAADGRCQCSGCSACGPGGCQRELEPGWHADHMQPHSHGGQTDVINGQALCPRCNLVKGATMLREWQQQAKEDFLGCGKPDFLLAATPGSGKTRFALDLARDLLATGQVERIVVVVPSDTLRQQWADQGDAFGIPLMPVSDAADYEKAGYRGCVVTYQQLRGGAQLVRRVTRRPALAILDEIHHAGEHRSWGDDLRIAVEPAMYRLALTGTPWRRDRREPIPFVQYDDEGAVIVDHAYEYGQAVADGVCRPIEFHAYDGEANWRDPFLPDPLVSVDLTNVDTNDIGIALSTVFSPSSPWITTLLAKGAAALEVMRGEVPDAGGLVVADNQQLAKAYAHELERITGEPPDLAISEHGPDAKATIDQFKAPGCRKRWIVAVRMVSEGVDIPRLAVGIYATRARTPLLFRQITGRFVRMRREDDPNSLLFIPAIREFVDLARQVEEELRHQLDLEEAAERERTDRQEPLEFRESISASEALLDRAILKGQDVGAAEVMAAEAECLRYGIPVNHAAAVARMLRERSPESIPVAPAMPARPKHRQERLLRSEVEQLSRRYAYMEGIEVRQVNTELLQQGFPRRAKCSVEELAQMKIVLTEWIAVSGR